MDIKELATGIQHLGLPTKDIAGTVEYYKKIGFSILLKGNVPDTGARVVFLQLGDLVVEAYEEKETAGKPGAIDHIAINVKDVDEAFRFINEAGLNNTNATIDSLPFFKNGVRFFIISGPNAERIEFNQYM